MTTVNLQNARCLRRKPGSRCGGQCFSMTGRACCREETLPVRNQPFCLHTVLRWRMVVGRATGSNTVHLHQGIDGPYGSTTFHQPSKRHTKAFYTVLNVHSL